MHHDIHKHSIYDSKKKVEKHRKDVPFLLREKICKTLPQMVEKAFNTTNITHDSPQIIRAIHKNTSRWKKIGKLSERKYALRNYENQKTKLPQEIHKHISPPLIEEFFHLITPQERQQILEIIQKESVYCDCRGGRISYGDIINFATIERIYTDILQSPTAQTFKKEIAFACQSKTATDQHLEAQLETFPQESQQLNTIERQIFAQQKRIVEKEIKLQREMGQLKHLIALNKRADQVEIDRTRLTSPEQRIKELEALLERKRRGEV